jgi:hypothetical protein
LEHDRVKLVAGHMTRLDFGATRGRIVLFASKQVLEQPHGSLLLSMKSRLQRGRIALRIALRRL